MNEERDAFSTPEERPLDQLADAPSAEAIERIKTAVQDAADKKK